MKTLCSIFCIFICTAMYSQSEDLNASSSLWRDSIWKPDIDVKATALAEMRNNLLFFDTCTFKLYSLLPKEIVERLTELDSIYIEEIFHKKKSLQKSTLQFKRRMQSYSYLSADLEFDLFFYYPKTYQIFQNKSSSIVPGNEVSNEVNVRVKLILNEIEQFIDSMTSTQIVESEQLINKLSELGINRATRILGGLPTKRQKYIHDIIDVLILTKRLNE